MRGQQYLVSARHVMVPRAKKPLSFHLVGTAGIVKVHGIMLPSDPDIDVVVFKLTKPVVADPIINIGIENIFLGSDVLAVGYPTGIYTSARTREGDLLQIPLSRKGTIAGIDTTSNPQKLILDLPSFPGISGAPILASDHTKRTGSKLAVVGVASQALWQRLPVRALDGQEVGDLHVREHIGLGVAVMATYILEIIASNDSPASP
ncbi:MAG: trypsin-like peptidase domain-containing protein [Bryobacterales bacterium]|nr:trypsin-like peptidase domain-containing protein [Bryobacterales bacterium]